MYKTEVFNTIDELEKLKSEWNELLKKCSTSTIFLTWEWINSWWQVFGGNAELLLITVRGSDGDLVGMAPLMIRKRRFYLFLINEITFIGSGLSDRQDFIIPKNNQQIAELILDTIHQQINRDWTILYFDQVPDTSLLINSDLREKYNVIIEESSVCPYIPIDDTWEEFWKTLSSKMRRDLNNKTNKISKTGEWEFIITRQDPNLDEIMYTIKTIEDNSRRLGTQKAYFTDDKNMIFMKSFLESCLKNKWFDFSHISLDGKIIAILLGFIHNNKYYAYLMTFDEEYYNLSPGKLLLNEKIKWCFEHGDEVNEFDFSRGDSYIKSRWTQVNRQHQRLIYFKGSSYSQLIKTVVYKIRPLIKKYILKR